MMRIAFDAKRAYSNGTGLGQYSRNLIAGMGRYFPEHRYYLLAGNPAADRFKLSYEGMTTLRPQGAWTVLPALWRSWGCREVVGNLGIDLYHGLSHEIPFGLKARGISAVVTMHDLIYERYPHQYAWVDRQIYRAKGRYACRHADRVVAISQQTADDLIEVYQVDPEKIRVCYQSCAPAFYEQLTEEQIDQVRNRYGLPSTYLLFVGSLIERKNLEGVLKGLHRIPAERRLPLAVVGSGSRDYEFRIRKYLVSVGMDHQVFFLKDHPAASASDQGLWKDLPALYQGAFAFLYPSFYEGFGIPVLEAMVSRTPVITSDRSCLPETGGEAALYVDPADPAALQSAIETLMDHPETREAMTEKGWLQAQKFSLEACTRQLMQVYEELA